MLSDLGFNIGPQFVQCVDEHVSRIRGPRAHLALAVFHLNDFSERHFDLEDFVLDAFPRYHVLQAEFHLVFVSGVDLDNIPVSVHIHSVIIHSDIPLNG